MSMTRTMAVGCFGLLAGAWLAQAAFAQAPAAAAGNNTVYTTNGVMTGSTAYIDASAFIATNSGQNMCQILNNILRLTPTTGAVIDARGFQNQRPPLVGIDTLDCTQNGVGSPFVGIVTPPPSTILLPFTNGDIKINSTWILPSNTHLIGQGAHSATQILAVASPFSGTSMIQMCATGSTCTGISVEDLELDASTSNINVQGINNVGAQSQSYVNDVGFRNMIAPGLMVASGAAGSGPYTNLSYGVGGGCTITGGCQGVVLQAATLGLHGVTVTGNFSVSCAPPSNLCDLAQPIPAAISVQASNNSIEDVHVEGFWDAIQIENTGSAPVAGIFISNVTGGASSGPNGVGPVTNTVHICGSHGSTSPVNFGKCASTGAVMDVTIIGATAASNGQADNNNGLSTSILDDVTGMALATTPVAGLERYSTAMYVLGEVGATTGSTSAYTLFNTSPSVASTATGSTVVPTWGVGIMTVAGTTCSTPGSLYSNTAGTQVAGTTVFVCSGGTWQPIL